ncbi:MAG: histidine phosphatase family protein [Acidimicrobiia bacterium]|nr:histidine phosphatase family protein [Acidimicrobiia bacterium]
MFRHLDGPSERLRDMKRLLLLRHAKSDWDSGVAGDHDRPLAGRGRKAARATGRFIALAGLEPDYAITSSAIRARTTLALAMESGDWTCPVNETRELYHAGVADVLAVVAESPEPDSSVMIVGHQPTWGGVVEALTGGATRMATGTLVGIDLRIDSWSSIRPGFGELAFVIPPRLLTDGNIQLG